jgi:uncharacterized protein (TIGR02996 family)
MNDRKALLRDICANPDDTGARLVYADWLDEHGDEKDRIRAEFIRLQCRIAALPEYEPVRLDLQEREKTLLDEHGDVWIREVPRVGRGAQAFVESTYLKALNFLHLSGSGIPAAIKKALEARFGKVVQV